MKNYLSSVEQLLALAEWRVDKIESLNTDEDTLLNLYYKLFPDECVELSSDSNYLGDFKINLLGAREEFNIEVFAHEIGHFIFFADLDLKRLYKRNYGMYSPQNESVPVSRVAKTTISVEHELAAVAISVRIMELWNIEDVSKLGSADLDLIVNRLNFEGKDLIMTGNNRALKLNRRNKDKRLEEIKAILSDVDSHGHTQLTKTELDSYSTEFSKVWEEIQNIDAAIEDQKQVDRAAWGYRIFKKYYNTFDLIKIRNVMGKVCTYMQEKQLC